MVNETKQYSKHLKLGEKIKKLRELKDYTQEYMAEQLGISQSAYSKMEIGESEITYNRLEKVAEVLKMKPEELITFNESMVFNVMHNQTGNGLVVQNNVPNDKERELYESKIKILQDELSYMKGLLKDCLTNK